MNDVSAVVSEVEEASSDTTAPSGSGGRAVGRGRWGRLRGRMLPYWLLVPALAALGLGLAYPLYRLGIMSVQEYGRRQHFGTEAPDWVGLDNFADIFGDAYFWTVLQRSVVFCAVNVALTMVLGTCVALLLGKLDRGMRTVVSVSLLLAWATPALTGTVVWQWMFDTRTGFVNASLTWIGNRIEWLTGADRVLYFEGHSWFAEPLSFFMVATLVIVWMGIPFVAFTLHAAMTQVPSDVEEAAAIDGAGTWQRFRDVTWPAIKPLFVVLVALSTLWDLRVFTQIYTLQAGGGTVRDTNLLGTWAFREATAGQHFDRAAAIAIVMVGITLLATMFHLRQMFKQDEV
jgi:N,N'-diacetylchitobiose transport system permease protein